ncbi:MAG: DUF1232 domain-containing protein [Dehalococcoidia bacterium]|nr:MAG: DUF1232 domain-containing protein [Dehalococcoidia bacterium]
MLATLSWWSVFLVFLGFLLFFLVAGAIVWWRSPGLRAVLSTLKALGWRRGIRGAWAITRDPRTPLVVRLLPIPLVVYLAMPFDFIPDFIPLLGQLDDVVVIALVAWIVVRLTPPDVLREHLGIERVS